MSNETETISSIVLKKKNKTCEIFVNNESRITISLDLIMKYRISKGIEWDNKLEELLKREQTLINVRQAAYNFASFKPRTIKQVKDKLKKERFNAEDIEKALIFLKDYRLIDDEKYAYTFAAEYPLRKGAGKPKLISELIQRGIEKELAHSAADEAYNNCNSKALAYKSANKKMKSIVKKPKEKRKPLLIAFLIRQGFDRDVIKEISEEMDFNDN